jgi:hypothetical protein
MRTVERIRIHRPRVRRERPWHEVLPPDPRDPDVVRAKALARAGDRVGRRTARQSHFPGLPRRRADSAPARWITR